MRYDRRMLVFEGRLLDLEVEESDLSLASALENAAFSRWQIVPDHRFAGFFGKACKVSRTGTRLKVCLFSLKQDASGDRIVTALENGDPKQGQWVVEMSLSQMLATMRTYWSKIQSLMTGPSTAMPGVLFFVTDKAGVRRVVNVSRGTMDRSWKMSVSETGPTHEWGEGRRVFVLWEGPRETM